MLLDEVKSFFEAAGVALEWRIDNGRPAVLRPPASRPLEVGTAVVIGDLHLGVGDDVFRYHDPERHGRFERFLDVLHGLARRSPDFKALQVGDWYDFWRVPPGTPEAVRRAVDAQYPGIAARARSLPLLHCIGNHDSQLAAAPPPPSEYDCAVFRLVGQEGICFHGHDAATLRDLVSEAKGRDIGVAIVNAINQIPSVGRLTYLLQRAADDSFQDPYLEASAASKPWPPALVPGPDGWDAPWVAREQAADLGVLIAGMQEILGRQLAIAFVGHTHRPGISWMPVGARRVPLVDVGSWTYGRAELAIVARDGVGLARLRGG